MSESFSQPCANTARHPEKPYNKNAQKFMKKLLRPSLLFVAALLIFLSFFRLLPSPFIFLQTQDERFERFDKQIFCNEMSGSSLNMHYTLADPSAYGIEKQSVSLGDASLNARKNACASIENYLKLLNSFDYDKLSKKHQLTYDIFQNYLETELSGADYLLYDEPLSPTLGVQAQLPILLAEYTFRTKGDIEDYLSLLSQIPDYFTSILSFEQEKAAEGLFMGRGCAADVINQCDDFIKNPEQNYLIDIFNEKIDSYTNLTADEKISFKNRNKAILEGYVIPAYQQLSHAVTSLCTASKNEKGLYYDPAGTNYYQYLIKSTVGDNRPVEEIEEAIKKQMVADFSDIQELSNLSKNLSEGENPTASSLSPEALLDDLRQKITKDFPLSPNVSCEVKYVHNSLQDYLSPAFYLTPAIDDYENNVIYINPASKYNSLELYTTLAHEGYPGHLYQSVTFQSQNPDLLRNLFDIGGYTEGWATYVEMYAYSLWEEDPDYAALCQKNRSFTLGLASLLDIGIHYRGYSLEEVTSFLEKLGFQSSTAQSLYRTILQSPANYLQYYVGYLNFCDLRDTAKEILKDRFSLKEFHRIILELGPAPFDILKKQMVRSLSS